MATDTELLERWRAGEAAAGGQLVDRYMANLERYFRSKSRAESDIEDLVADTLEACVTARERFAGHSSFRTYLFGIAHNKLLRYLRGQRTRPDAEDIDEVPVRDLNPGASTLLFAKAERRLLLEGLRSLPLMYQVALELNHLENMGRAEIAEVLGIPEGTVATRLRTGRARLEQALAELADSPRMLHSTLTELDDWAAQVRQGVPAKDS